MGNVARGHETQINEFSQGKEINIDKVKKTQ